MEYVLDVSKWRCGGRGEHQLGDGIFTQLLNLEGYMCCLGMFAKQKGIKDNDLYIEVLPQNVANHLGKVYDPLFTEEIGSNEFSDTQLATELMGINDDEYTTYQDKIKLIREKLEEHGHTLKVINDTGKKS